MRLLRSMLARWMIAWLLVGGAAVAHAQVAPPSEAQLRAEVVEALQPEVQRELGRSVRIEIVEAVFPGAQALVKARVSEMGGAPIDWASTRFAEDADPRKGAELEAELVFVDPPMGWKIEFANLWGVEFARDVPARPLGSPNAPSSAAEIRDLERGDPERSALMDALRPAIEQEVCQALRFNVAVIRLEGDSAWVQAEPITPAGAKIDLTKAPAPCGAVWREAQIRDAEVFALLRRGGGGWFVIEHVVSPGDMFSLDWPARFGVSPELMLPAPSNRPR